MTYGDFIKKEKEGEKKQKIWGVLSVILYTY